MGGAVPQIDANPLEKTLCGDGSGEGRDGEQERSQEEGWEATADSDVETYRLIEAYFPSESVSERSQKERYQRGKTPHTIFTWWARRPYAAACGIATTALLKTHGLSGGYRDLVDQYCKEEQGGGLSGMGIRTLCDFREQRVLDPFGGGGTFPLEAARLGAKTYALDNNELAHFIQTTLLRFSQQEEALAEVVRARGEALLEALKEETAQFFPGREAGEEGRAIAYLWSREVQCPGCEGWLSLMRRPWLVRRGKRNWFVERGPKQEEKRYSVAVQLDGEPTKAGSAWDGREIECPFCEHRVEREQIGSVMEEGVQDRLLVVCTSQGRASRQGKAYQCADCVEDWFPAEEALRAAMEADLGAMGEELPEAELPSWSGVTNPALYGLKSHVDLFNLRQRAVLVRFCRLLREHFAQWKRELGEERARVVAAFLSALVDQLVDWNSRLSTWISQNEQVGRGLSGPGMAMIWDHVEVDPLEEAPANLWDKLERIVQGIEAIPEFEHTPEVVRGDARKLPFEDNYFDVIATDPPYFDNIFYNVLADCVYVWKRLALKEIFPAMFKAEMTDRSRELTMNRHVHESVGEATDFYTNGMEQALAESRRVLKNDGVLALVYAHSTVEGWAAMVRAFREARLDMVAAWPMYVERQHRPRGMSSRAINTSFVLVAKKRLGAVARVQWSDFEERLRRYLIDKVTALQLQEKYGPDTKGRTLFGHGVSLYSQAGHVMEGGEEVVAEELLERITKLVEELVGEEAWGVRRS